MPSYRLQELDLLRGLSVITMILVITPGAWGLNYAWLNHATWEGWVIADMIFPTFLFCVGFAIPLSLSNRLESGCSHWSLFRHVFVRSVLLMGIGMLINFTRNFEISELRIPGILQRIGLCFFLVSSLVLYLASRNKQQAFHLNVKTLIVIAILILFFHWCFYTFIPVPGFGVKQFNSFGSWSSYVDQAVFGINHMWIWGQTDGVVTYDPDGLFSSLPACINVLAGTILALLYQQKSRFYTPIHIALLGIVLLILGFLIQGFSPMIKKLWTSSFTLSSIGFSILMLVALSAIKKNPLTDTLLHPLKIFGANALLALIISFLSLMWWLNIPILASDQNARNLGFQALNSFIPSPAFASLMFGLIYIALLYALLSVMHKKRWHVKL